LVAAAERCAACWLLLLAALLPTVRA
jgi:hypothetical protein